MMMCLFKEAIEKMANKQRKIMYLINNAGYALNGAFEDLAMEEIKDSMKPMCLVL